MTHAHDTLLQANASAIMLGAGVAKQGTSACDCQVSVKTDRQPSVTRSGSWGISISQKGLGLDDPVTGCSGTGGLEREESVQDEAKPIVLDRPLVVDGSGLQKNH